MKSKMSFLKSNYVLIAIGWLIALALLSDRLVFAGEAKLAVYVAVGLVGVTGFIAIFLWGRKPNVEKGK